jgi:hypothetical protein
MTRGRTAVVIGGGIAGSGYEAYQTAEGLSGTIALALNGMAALEIVDVLALSADQWSRHGPAMGRGW